MPFHRSYKPNSKNTQVSLPTSGFTSSSFAPQYSQQPPTEEEIEHQAFEQDKFEATGLQAKEQYGKITPVEQERLGVLQAKMDSFWVQRRERTKGQPNLLEILVRNAEASQETAPAAPVQPKLTIGQQNDVYEQEADRVAEEVMKISDSPTPQPVQREVLREDEEEVQTKPLAASITPLGQIEVMPEEEESIQPKPSPIPNSQHPTPSLESRLNSSKSGGSPLPNEVRAFMEPRFGADFNRVQVHTDSEAVQMNQELNAQAFTHGSHIYFGHGKSPAKDALTAHELTHVEQQTGVEPLQAKLSNQETQPNTIAKSQDGLVQRYPNTLVEAAQMGFADSILRLSIDQVIQEKKAKKDLINEAFWTAYPQMKGQKISDENVPDPELKQTYIEAYLYIQDTLYPPIEREARKSAKPVLEEPEASLDEPLQDPKAEENGGANKKKKTSNDVVVPKSSNQGIPGLPDKPQLEHPEFSAIVQAMEQMEQNPLKVEEKHKEEETGEARTERVEKIAELRKRIATLGETIPDVEASKIKDAQAYLYRRLAPLSPYYGQMANTNILEKGSKGWDRTCNVTVPAMVIEGIGKTKDNYDQSKLPLLKRIFNALEGKYKDRKEYDDATDFDALRLPDFMALIGIARWMPGDLDSLADEEFVKAVSKARQTAASKTTAHATMMYLIEQFGGSHEQHSVHSKDLDKIGGAQKDYTKAELRGKTPKQWRELYNEVEAKKKSFDKLNKDEQKGYQTLWKYEQFNKEEADKLLPVDTYREAVLKEVNPLLDKGAQILVGMEQHFIRLDSLDQESIQADDPGEKGFKNLQLTWEQARNLGYFKTFWEITG